MDLRTGIISVRGLKLDESTLVASLAIRCRGFILSKFQELVWEATQSAGLNSVGYIKDTYRPSSY
jgi:hypothetical protein